MNSFAPPLIGLGTGATMPSDRISAMFFRLLCLLLLTASLAAAQDDKTESVPIPKDLGPQQKQFEDMVEQTRALGPWEQQAALNAQAADLFFERQNWNSEPDQFARSILRDVDRVPPWQFKERMDVFLSGMQGRYNLTENQKSDLGRRLNLESMRLTLTHFKDMAPIAMEILKTRSTGQPFTAEQVARWSAAIKPILDDGRHAIDRVAQELMKTMTPEQRRIVEMDLAAFHRRHGDVAGLVEKWERGEWDPTQWGLDHDPIHAAAVAEVRARQAALQAIGRSDANARPVEPPANPENESTWERYVRDFAAAHRFDTVQIRSARAILAEQVARATAFRKSHARQIAQLQAAVARETDVQRRGEKARELQDELAPIGEMFKELCARLEELLTAEQRIASSSNPPKVDAPQPSRPRR